MTTSSLCRDVGQSSLQRNTVLALLAVIAIVAGAACSGGTISEQGSGGNRGGNAGGGGDRGGAGGAVTVTCRVWLFDPPASLTVRVTE